MYMTCLVQSVINFALLSSCFLVCVAIIVHQESVCATFGSGLSSACVVDVGDQKTSLCCVEDGVSHRNSRLNWVIYGYKLFSSWVNCRLWSKFRYLIHNCDLLCMVGADCWFVNRDDIKVCYCFQGVFGVRRLRCDPYFLLAPTEGGLSL